MTTTILTPVKEVKYDAETRDFCATVNGEIVGWAPTKIQAQVIADEYVYNLLERPNVTAGELDITPEEAADLVEAQRMVEAEHAAPVYGPGGIDYEVGGISYTLSADGYLIVYTARSGEKLTTMRPSDVYALYVFLAKLPGVATRIEELGAQRQIAFFEQMERDQRGESVRMKAFADGRDMGQREAWTLILAKLREIQAQRSAEQQAA